MEPEKKKKWVYYLYMVLRVGDTILIIVWCNCITLLDLLPNNIPV